jgi:DNA-binding NarL/FixJ family response regulator
MAKGKIRILLAGKSNRMWSDFKASIVNEAKFVVVAEADYDENIPDLISVNQPDVVLIDIDYAEPRSVEAFQLITLQSPDTKVIILSSTETPEHVLQALDAGALGYLLKDSMPAQYKLAILKVAEGHTFLCQEVQNSILEYAQSARTVNTQAKELLTPRQNQVLLLIIEGFTSKQIATHFDLSEKTIESHRAEIMRRLQAKNLPDLVRIAIQSGLYPTHKR